jgi:hypothetical protein
VTANSAFSKAVTIDYQLITSSVPKSLVFGTLDYQSFTQWPKIKHADNQRVS